MQETAVLYGGPAAGQTVKFWGMCYAKKMSRSLRHAAQLDFYDAVYLWQELDSGTIIGVFKGYFRGATRVDKLGRKIGKREGHQRRTARPLSRRPKLRVVRPSPGTP
jgi:hypothetical protein